MAALDTVNTWKYMTPFFTKTNGTVYLEDFEKLKTLVS